jgi:hypothetical protein
VSIGPFLSRWSRSDYALIDSHFRDRRNFVSSGRGLNGSTPVCPARSIFFKIVKDECSPGSVCGVCIVRPILAARCSGTDIRVRILNHTAAEVLGVVVEISVIDLLDIGWLDLLVWFMQVMVAAG